jgi:release factor glutamine methyltransferase
VALLEEGGFVAADEEADELLSAAGGDHEALVALVRRRLTGEPLAWVTGSVRFAGVTLRVHEGVYVPRWHTEALAERAAARLPDGGVAVDLCTGTGAIAAVLAARRPGARVLATDLDPRAVACARANGVDAHAGDLFAGLPGDVAAAVRGRVDVVAGVVPYVPTPALPLLQRDTLAFESTLSYDGGEDGTRLLRRAAVDAAAFLHPGGALLLELGGDEADALAPDLAAHGYTGATVLTDEDGDVRGVEVTYAGATPTGPTPG